MGVNIKAKGNVTCGDITINDSKANGTKPDKVSPVVSSKPYIPPVIRPSVTRKPIDMKYTPTVLPSTPTANKGFFSRLDVNKVWASIAGMGLIILEFFLKRR